VRPHHRRRPGLSKREREVEVGWVRERGGGMREETETDLLESPAPEVRRGDGEVNLAPTQRPMPWGGEEAAFVLRE
jgi:hypothetical protein